MDNVPFRFSVNEIVEILELTPSGRVLACKWDGYRQAFEVRFLFDGKYREEWFYGEELKTTGKVIQDHASHH